MVSAAGGIILAILVLVVVGAVGWFIFTQLRARRLGLPPPSLSSYIPFRKSDSFGPPRPASGGIVGWINGKISSFKNRNNRSAVGAYEQPSGGAARRGFGPLDPDEAWDARVGHEAETYGPYGSYEEQELGYRGNGGGNGGGGGGGGGVGGSYPANLAPTPGLHEEDRGRSLSRPGDDDVGLSVPKGGRNPFDDDAEPSNISMRGVSPRPIVDTGSQPLHQQQQQPQQQNKDSGESPTERRSIFRENV